MFFFAQNLVFAEKKFYVQNKKRRKTTRDTMYSAMSSIPSGRPPGRTHTQELRYSLRGTDARLESVLSTDKCLCDACCARFSTPNFVVFVLVFWTEFFFCTYGLAPFSTDVSVFANTFYKPLGGKSAFFSMKNVEN